MPHPVEQVEPAPALQRDVEHHEARPPHLDRPHPLPRTRRPRHPEPVGGEVVEQNARVASSSSTTKSTAARPCTADDRRGILAPGNECTGRRQDLSDEDLEVLRCCVSGWRMQARSVSLTVEDRPGDERAASRLDRLRQRRLTRVQPVGRAARRARAEGDDGCLRLGGELQLGFTLDERGQLAGECVRARHLGGDAGASARGDGRPGLQRAERSGLLGSVLGEGANRRIGRPGAGTAG